MESRRCWIGRLLSKYETMASISRSGIRTCESCAKTGTIASPFGSLVRIRLLFSQPSFPVVLSTIALFIARSAAPPDLRLSLRMILDSERGYAAAGSGRRDNSIADSSGPYVDEEFGNAEDDRRGRLPNCSRPSSSASDPRSLVPPATHVSFSSLPMPPRLFSAPLPPSIDLHAFDDSYSDVRASSWSS